MFLRLISSQPTPIRFRSIEELESRKLAIPKLESTKPSQNDEY